VLVGPTRVTTAPQLKEALARIAQLLETAEDNAVEEAS